MKRGGPLRVDPEKQRAWQARSKPLSRAKTATPSSAPRPRQSRSQQATTKPRRRRNDAPWRAEVEALRGSYCRACLTTRDLQCDHVVNRSQQGPSIVENGLMLCREHHQMITENKIQYRFEWFDPDQIAWFHQIGWVTWDADGRPRGRGMRYFAARGAA